MDAQWIVGLLALSAMEIVLGIDNIVFLSIVTAKLPRASQPTARRVGLALALLMRVGLLLTIRWIMKLDQPLFHLDDLGIPRNWIQGLDHSEAIRGISAKDLILLLGGMFLIGKSVCEIHEKIEHTAREIPTQGGTTLVSAIFQIVVLDLVFSLDSVITAVGMVDDIWVMIVAVVVAMTVMLVFAQPIGDFVARHPTITMLALSFLIMIGVMLVAEGLGTHINKNYIYFAMAFAFVVEMLNLRLRQRGGGSAGNQAR